MGDDSLGSLEILLSRLPEAQRPSAAALVLASEAAAGSSIDLAAYGDDARAFVDSFPIHGKAVVNVLDRAAQWLARRMAMGEGTSAREALARELAGAVAGREGDAPLVAAAVGAIVEAPAPEDAAADPVWLGLARAVVGDAAGVAGA